MKYIVLVTLLSFVVGAPPAGATAVSDSSPPSGEGQSSGQKTKTSKNGVSGWCQDRAGYWYRVGASITNYQTKRYSECTWGGWRSWEMCPAGARIANRDFCWSRCYPWRSLWCNSACQCVYRQRRAEVEDTEERQEPSLAMQPELVTEERRRAPPAGAIAVSDSSAPGGDGQSSGQKTKSSKNGVSGWCQDRAGYWYRVGASITNQRTKRYSECTWGGWRSWALCEIYDRDYCWSRCYPFRGYCYTACDCVSRIGRRLGEPAERLTSML